MTPTTMGSNYEQLYNMRKRTGLYGKLDRFDLIEKMQPQLQSMSYYINGDGIICRADHLDAKTYETPWNHIRSCPYKQCNIDMQIKFQQFGYIPPRCLECWKVVVAPRTVKELFKLVEVERSLNRPSKCGIELRSYTSRPYGGYFYNNHIDEGMDTYELVRKAIDEHLDPEVPVILKRGCTEYEMICGDSMSWHLPDWAVEIDQYIETFVRDHSNSDSGQSSLVTNHVHKRWIEYAHKIGDTTYKEYTDGESLYPAYRTYHDLDLTTAKVDMTVARAKAQGVPETVTRTILSDLGNEMNTAQIGRREMGTIMGFHNIDPLTIYEYANYQL